MIRLAARSVTRLKTGSGLVGSDLRCVRRPVTAAAVLMLAGLVVGYVIHDPAGGAGAADSTSLYDFEEPTVVDIAVNNLAVMVVLVSGALTLGALTVSALVFNGFVLGTVAKSLVASGASHVEVAALILPHAVFELAGLLLAAAVALSVVGNVLSYLVAVRDAAMTRAELRRDLRLILLATVLVLWGALIEVHVTMAVA